MASTEELLEQALARAEQAEAKAQTTDPKTAAAFAELRSEDPDASGPLVRHKAKYIELRAAEESERAEHAELTLGPNPVGRTTEPRASYRPRSRDAFVTEPSIQRKRALGLDGQVVETGRTVGGQTARIAIVPTKGAPSEHPPRTRGRIGIAIAISMVAGALLLWVSFGRRASSDTTANGTPGMTGTNSPTALSTSATATFAAQAPTALAQINTAVTGAGASATPLGSSSHPTITTVTPSPNRSAPKASTTAVVSAPASAAPTGAPTASTTSPKAAPSSSSWQFFP
ncbi:MAG: hypothetical protein U0271_16145 [Polyangiaceae bacterium]